MSAYLSFWTTSGSGSSDKLKCLHLSGQATPSGSTTAVRVGGVTRFTGCGHTIAAMSFSFSTSSNFSSSSSSANLIRLVLMSEVGRSAAENNKIKIRRYLHFSYAILFYNQRSVILRIAQNRLMWMLYLHVWDRTSTFDVLIGHTEETQEHWKRKMISGLKTQHKHVTNLKLKYHRQWDRPITGAFEVCRPWCRISKQWVNCLTHRLGKGLQVVPSLRRCTQYQLYRFYITWTFWI